MFILLKHKSLRFYIRLIRIQEMYKQIRMNERKEKIRKRERNGGKEERKEQ